MAKPSIALQLYTVRDLTRTDFAGTVRQVAELGYKAVELAGYGNLKTASEAKKALDDANLRVAAAHIGIEQLEKDLSRVLDENQLLGNPNIVCPWMPEDRRKDAAGWKSSAAALDRIGAECRKRGMTLSYHNHSFEFQVFDGKCGLDILFENTDPENLRAELDVYWVKHGGHDPVGYINKLGSRILLLHLKDMAAGPEPRFAEVGSGTLDFAAMLSAGEKLGVPWGIVEQDNTYGAPPLECARRSLEHLKRLGAQ